MSPAENVISEQELQRQRDERIAVLDRVIGLFGAAQLPPTSDLIEMADWVLTGMADIAQGNDRVTAQNYDHREPPT